LQHKKTIEKEQGNVHTLVHSRWCNKGIKEKGAVFMPAIIIFFGIICVVVCLAKGHNNKTPLGIVLAILYFPIGVILSLAKKYK